MTARAVGGARWPRIARAHWLISPPEMPEPPRIGRVLVRTGTSRNSAGIYPSGPVNRAPPCRRAERTGPRPGSSRNYLASGPVAMVPRNATGPGSNRRAEVQGLQRFGACDKLSVRMREQAACHGGNRWSCRGLPLGLSHPGEHRGQRDDASQPLLVNANRGRRFRVEATAGA